jgi:hypothetical protein
MNRSPLSQRALDHRVAAASISRQGSSVSAAGTMALRRARGVAGGDVDAGDGSAVR